MALFWDANAFQCGFCLSGHVLCTVALPGMIPPLTTP
jgi:aerobic-type carbon monoxide dehydrogenase small subunit (CoxS/CutS family)